MATALFYQEGDQLDFTPASAVTAGDVIVQGDAALVAVADIPAGRKGALVAEGVFKFPKATTTGSGMPMGKRVYWDATNLVATRSAGGGVNKVLGLTAAPTADSDTIVPVKLYAAGGRPPFQYLLPNPSATIANTNVQTTFNQSCPIPANTLGAGDIIRVRAAFLVNAASGNPTLQLALLFGSQTVAMTPAVALAAGTGLGFFDALIGLTTPTYMFSSGLFSLTSALVPTPYSSYFGIDTTSNQAISFAATWSVASANNSVQMSFLSVQIERGS